jgi:C4-dicarboxylate-specific signal transduction histidine kinase
VYAGERRKIRVCTSLVADAVQVAIGHTETGNFKAMRGRIFDPFFAIKEAGRGTGQALAVSPSVVVDRH